MIDCHAHLLTSEIYPEDLFYGRFDIPKDMVEKALAIIGKDDRLAIADVVAEVFGFITSDKKFDRVVHLVQAFQMTLEKQAELFVKQMASAGVDKACILGLDLPDWIEMKSADQDEAVVRQIQCFTALKKKYPQLLFFLPFDPRRKGSAEIVQSGLGSPLFSGVKMYPALGYDVTTYMNNDSIGVALDKVFTAAEAYGKPIITHCSRGGIHGPECHAGDSQYFSRPDMWAPALTDYPNLRVCLAHSGGEGDFRSLAGSDPKGWASKIETLLMNFPNLYTDVAFHSGIVTDSTEYFACLRSVMGSGIAGQILFGSDWPLHMVSYDYGMLISHWKSNCLEDYLEIFNLNAEYFLGFAKKDSEFIA